MFFFVTLHRFYKGMMKPQRAGIVKKFVSWYFSREALPFWAISVLDITLIFMAMLFMYSLVYGPARLVGNGSFVLYTLLIDLVFYGIGMRIFHTYTDVSKILAFKDLSRTAFAMLVGTVLCMSLRWAIDVLPFTSQIPYRVFVLTFFGCGTAVVTGCSVDNPGAYLLTALAFGLSIVTMAYCVGQVSGGHFNPAVSFAMLIRGKLEAMDFIGYVVAQCLGGLAAGGCLAAILGAETGVGSNGLYNGNIGLSILIEVILTFVFLLAILGVTSKSEYSSVAGIQIGLALTFVHILGIGFTGTSVNPARSLVAVFAGGEALSALWVFIVAPLIGAALAAVVWGIIKPEN